MEPALAERSEGARFGRAYRRLMRLECGRTLTLPARNPTPRPFAGDDPGAVDLASDVSRPVYGRVAALFALKQLDGIASHEILQKLTRDEAVREFALRALVDRESELKSVEPAPFRAALADRSPRVRAQALIALSRLGDVGSAPAIIPLTSRPRAH